MSNCNIGSSNAKLSFWNGPMTSLKKWKLEEWVALSNDVISTLSNAFLKFDVVYGRFCEFANLHFSKKILQSQMQKMDPHTFTSNDDFVYNLRSASHTFQVHESNYTYRFMNFSDFAWRSFTGSRMDFLDVVFKMSNCNMLFSNANVYLLFSCGFSVTNLHLRNAFWLFQIAFWILHYSFSDFEQVTNTPLQMPLNSIPNFNLRFCDGLPFHKLVILFWVANSSFGNSDIEL